MGHILEGKGWRAIERVAIVGIHVMWLGSIAGCVIFRDRQPGGEVSEVALMLSTAALLLVWAVCIALALVPQARRLGAWDVFWGIFCAMANMVGLLGGMVIFAMAAEWAGVEHENWGGLGMILIGYPCLAAQVLILPIMTLRMTQGKHGKLPDGFRFAVWTMLIEGLVLSVGSILWFHLTT